MKRFWLIIKGNILVTILLIIDLLLNFIVTPYHKYDWIFTSSYSNYFYHILGVFALIGIFILKIIIWGYLGFFYLFSLFFFSVYQKVNKTIKIILGYILEYNPSLDSEALGLKKTIESKAKDKIENKLAWIFLQMVFIGFLIFDIISFFVFNDSLINRLLKILFTAPS